MRFVVLLALLGLHALLGVGAFYVPVLAKVFAWLLIAGTLIYTLVARRWETLVYVTAYITGAEVFTRMTRGLFFYESHKYLAILLFLGILFRKGIRWSALPYFIYVLMLIPGVLYTWWVEAADPSYIHIDLRKDILFNIAGPLALGIGAMSLAGSSFSLQQFRKLLIYLLLPIVSTLFYIIFRTPDLREIIFTTQANFATSGGFGPNQVATILGLGIFASFVLFLLSENFWERVVFLGLSLVMSYRAFLTFSRGGTVTGIAMIIIFIVVSWRSPLPVMRAKNKWAILVSVVVVGFAYLAAMEITRGMLYNRYAGLNAKGIKKSDITSGRLELFLIEIKDFIDHPAFGAGVGRAKIQRREVFGMTMATHNEISRLLAEHGIFGLLALFVLIFTPVFQGVLRRDNLFFYPFFAFWILTIFHSSMRLVAPAAMYAFSLIYLYEKDRRLHRE